MLLVVAAATASCTNADDHVTVSEAADMMSEGMPESEGRLAGALRQCIESKHLEATSPGATTVDPGCEHFVWQECLRAWAEEQEPEVGDWVCEDIGVKP